MSIAVIAATAVWLSAACWTDLRRMEIPNGLTVSFAAGGLLYQILCHGIAGIGWSLVGTAAGLLPFLVLYLLRGIGGGDVKWFAAFGTWTGTAAVLRLEFSSILIAGGIALLLLLFRMPGLRSFAMRWRWPWGMHPAEGRGKAKFPFMLAVAPAYIAVIWNSLAN